MTQPYLVAMEHAEWHAKNVIRKHAKNRPLGRMEIQHRYNPPQPVLSCRTVDIDLSGTRTYRAKSASDIIDEQHKLIHFVYSSARNVSSAPVRRIISPQQNQPGTGLKTLNIQGVRPHTSKDSRPASSIKPVLRSRPHTATGVRVSGTPRTSLSLQNIFIRDPDWDENSKAYQDVNSAIHEQWSEEKHSLDEGQFIRGKKDNKLMSIDPKTGNQWMVFGGGQKVTSGGVVDAFTAMKSQGDFYSIDGSTGSHVAKQLQKGDKIRIGRNGNVHSADYKLEKWTNEQGKKLREMEDSRRGHHNAVVPLCWGDQLKQQEAKIVSPRNMDGNARPMGLCESHPVIVNEESECSLDSHILKKDSKGTGYKIKVRSKDHISMNGHGAPASRRITNITIDKNDEKLDKEIENLTYDDILQMKVAVGKTKKPQSAPVQENMADSCSSKESLGPDVSDSKIETMEETKAIPFEDRTLASKQVAETISIHSEPASRASLIGSRPSTAMSGHHMIPDYQELDSLVVGQAPPGQPAGRLPRPTGSASSDQQGRRPQRISSAGRPPPARPNLHRTTAASGQSISISRGDTEFIQISTPVRSVSQGSSRPASRGGAPSPGPSTHAAIVSIMERNKMSYSDEEPKDIFSMENPPRAQFNENNILIDPMNGNQNIPSPVNTPPPSPTPSLENNHKYAFDIPTAETMDSEANSQVAANDLEDDFEEEDYNFPTPEAWQS